MEISTDFNEIYSMNEILKDDNRLIGKPQNLIYELYFQYLKYSIGLFKFDCRKDLTARTDFSQKIYNFISDGSDKEYYCATPVDNGDFYVAFVNSNDEYVEITDYSFDQTTDIMTINESIPSGMPVYIASYFIGQFSDTLDELEIDILSQAMLVPWSTEQLMKNSLLQQLVMGGFSRASGTQANHIREVKDVSKNQYLITVKGMISDYSYKGSDVKGLGGKAGCT